MRKKLVINLILFIFLINLFLPIIKAIDTEETYLKYDHVISNTHIMFYGMDNWYEIKLGYICYEFEGKEYPAYSITDGNQGIVEAGKYNVKIDSVIKNDLIYNTILNGYPYKTANELGLSNNDDAYVATKQAIYSVMSNCNVKEFYKALDEEGEKIIDAIYNISENGKKLNEKSNKNIEIKKIGDIKKFDDKNYYQEFEIKSDVEIVEYSVNDMFENNIYIADTDGNKRNSFSNLENFRLIIPNECLYDDIDLDIEIQIETISNPILYGRASNNNYQDYAITFQKNTKNNISTKFYHKNNLSNIKILKYDEETNEIIKECSFSIYDENMKLIKEIASNESGVIEFKDLYKGKYFVKETKENNNYIVENEIFDINLNYDETIIKTITNMHKKGNLIIENIDKDDKKQKITNVEYELIDKNGNIIKNLISDSNGEIKLENLNIGNYILKPININDKYNLNEEIDVEVEWNKNTEMIIESEKKKGQIKIIKEDLEFEKIKLCGVEFEILNENNDVIEIMKTDINGEALSNKLPLGKYTIREINLNENLEYISNKETIEIEIEEDNIKTITSKSIHKKGKLQILNIDEENENLKLNNSKFEITDYLGNKNIIETDANGIATLENIPTGKININLIDINSNYIFNKNIIEENIYENNTTKIEFKNTRKKGQLEINMYDENSNEIRLAGVEFVIYDIERKIVNKTITNDNGYLIIKELPIGKYFVQEVKTNKKYILNSEILEVEVENNKTTTLNLKGKKIKGKIQILKTSSNNSEIFNIKMGQMLEGVSFDIYDDKNNLVETIITDEDGQAISNQLEYGRYFIKEKNRKKNFLINNNIYLANITQDNEVVNISVQNEPIIPRINVKKIVPQYAEKNEEIKYEICVENKSNSIIENFELKEYIPYESTSITKLVTGVYNFDVECNIYYKTNIKDYQLLKTVNSINSEYIDFSKIQLSKKEKITEIKIDFGSVEENFISEINPIFYMKVNNNVNKKDIITNKVELIGKVEDNILIEDSKSETIVIEREVIKKLPNTGG